MKATCCQSRNWPNEASHENGLWSREDRSSLGQCPRPSYLMIYIYHNINLILSRNRSVSVFKMAPTRDATNIWSSRTSELSSTVLGKSVWLHRNWNIQIFNEVASHQTWVALILFKDPALTSNFRDFHNRWRRWWSEARQRRRWRSLSCRAWSLSWWWRRIEKENKDLPEILQSFQVHLHLPTDVNRLPGGNQIQIHWSFTQCLFEWILILVVVCKTNLSTL